jgi:four helix bundle protein
MERKSAETFKDLIVWQKAHQFVLNVYRFTDGFPKSELYGLTSQFRRAAISIAANIAEGFKKKGINDKLRFFNISQGSAEECHYYLILSNDLGYGDSTELILQLDTVERLLRGYMTAISKTLIKSPT